MWDRLVRNALSNVTGTAVSLAIGFVTLPLVVHHLGPTAFGLWVLATGVVGHFGVLDLGLGPTVVKKSAELLAHGEEGVTDVSETVSTVFVLYAALGVLGLGVVAGVVAGAGRLFHVPAADLELFRAVLLVVGVQAALGLPLSVWNGLLAGLEAFPLLNGLGILTTVLRGGATVALVTTGHGLGALVMASFAVSVLGWTLAWRCAHRRLPGLRVGPRGFRRARLPEIGRFSGAMVVWSIAGAALHQLDRVLIGVVLPVRALATWEVGARLSNYSRNVLHSWLAIVMPATAGLAARGERGRLRALFLRGTRYLLASYGAVVVVLLGYGAPFIALWMGPDFAESYGLLCVLLVGSAFQSQNVVAHVMLPAMGELRVFTRFMAIYPLVTATFAVAGIVGFGLPGLAAGVAGSMAVMESAFLVVVLPRFGVSAWQLARRCHLPVARALAPAVGWVVISRALVPVGSWGVLVLLAGGALGLYAVAFWTAGLSPAERRLLRARAASLPRPLGTGGRLTPEAWW